MSEPPRVMLDANLLIGAFLAPRASRRVMEWAREGRVTLVLCPYVIGEARRMISHAFLHRLAEFDALIACTPHALAPDPSPEVVAEHPGLIQRPADLPVPPPPIHARVDNILNRDGHLLADDEST